MGRVRRSLWCHPAAGSSQVPQLIWSSQDGRWTWPGLVSQWQEKEGELDHPGEGAESIIYVIVWFEQNHWKSVFHKTWVILVFPTSTAVLLRQQDNKKECAHCTNLRIHIQKYRKILLYLLKNFTHPTPEAENSAFEYFIIWNESDKRLFEKGAIKDYLKSVRLKIIWNRCN